MSVAGQYDCVTKSPMGDQKSVLTVNVDGDSWTGSNAGQMGSLDITDGKVDGFTCSVGSGGTLGGVARALKERNPNIKIALSDPMGSALYNWHVKGELKAEGNSVTEGIGQGRVTANIDGTPIDFAYQIADEEALPVLFDLIEHEGLVLGGSTAINIVGAMRLARDLGPGKTVVTILADGGQRYQSKLFNPVFLREKNLPLPPWMK